jgi:hypothetical protein
MLVTRLSLLVSNTALAVFVPFHLFGSSVIQANICSVPATAPMFTTQSNTTTATTEVISGTTSANTNLTVADNNQQVASLTSDGSGGFSVQVSLGLGTNSFTATATNSCGSVNSTGSLVITRTTPPPPPPGVPTGSPATTSGNSGATSPTAGSSPSGAAGTSSPASASNATAGSPPLQLLGLPGSAYTAAGASTTSQSIFLQGITTPGATVTISDNGRQVAQVTAAADGSFGVSVPLSKGRNVITITISLNGQSTTRTITYNRLAPALHHSNTTWKLVSAAGSCLLLGAIASLTIVRHRHRQANWPRAGA